MPGQMAPPAAPLPGPAPALTNDAAFACDEKDNALVSRRLWRLSPAQYRNTIAAAFGSGSADSVPFELVNTGDRFGNLARSYSMNDLEFRQAMDSTQTGVSTYIASQRADSGSCLFKGTKTPFADCMKQLIARNGPVLFRRPLTDEESKYFLALGVDNLATLGEDDAALLVFQRMLMSIHFLFRTEIGDPATAANGLVRLTPYEIASAISYTLTDQPPNAALKAAAAAGALGTPEQIKTQIDLLVGGAKLSMSEAVVRFFKEYTEYSKAPTVFKDSKDFPLHRPADLVGDTTAWIKGILTTNARSGLLKALLTSNEGFAQGSTAKTYGVAVTGEKTIKTAFPAEQRAGFLTQPTFLVAFSKSTENAPVQRGRFISESLLCRPIPEIPIGVVPTLPHPPDATMRERLQVHMTAKDNCSACHALMDPLGLAFEMYDHVGRYRTMEGKKMIDPSGMLTGAGQGVDGAFSGPIQLAQKLAASPVVAGCMVRHSFRYWMGREEVSADGCSLRAALEVFSKNDGDYEGMLTSLFTSKSFLYRSTATK